MKYSKAHTCDFDEIKLGIMICYDNDCESMKPKIQPLSTRAYENMVGVAMPDVLVRLAQFAGIVREDD